MNKNSTRVQVILVFVKQKFYLDNYKRMM